MTRALLLLAACVSIALPAAAQVRSRQESQPITRAEIEAAVDCATLPAGVECTCVVERAFTAAPSIPAVTILNEANRADHREINRQIVQRIRISQAVEAGKTACAPPEQPAAETNAQP
jgi:hypothetical protein